MKIDQILRTLPHRYPMLLVDRIVSISEGRTKCRSIKNVTINEPFFQGHYPMNPIMPGVLIIEAMAQAGAALILADEAREGLVPLIGAIDNVRFKRPVIPGDQLVIDTELLWIRGTVGKITSHASVDEEIAASMEMVFKLVK
ncbi:MAG: 3-hydroxyacyl-ACP dehydratase FabZ, partial [Armatimonadota bacterium]